MRRADLSQRKIMIVDGNSHYVRLIERILQFNSYQNILSTTDPMKAIDMYVKTQPDLLLMDMEMTSINGMDVLKMLQIDRHSGSLPVILFSDKTDTDQKARALDLGAQDVIAKPFRQTEFVASIQRFFEQNQQTEN